LQVSQSPGNARGTVSELTYGVIAARTQNASQLARFMAVVYVRGPVFGRPAERRRAGTDSAQAALRLQQRVPTRNCQAVLGQQVLFFGLRFDFVSVRLVCLVSRPLFGAATLYQLGRSVYFGLVPANIFAHTRPDFGVRTARPFVRSPGFFLLFSAHGNARGQ
jgi:hypothetical protein